jgi:hypothetical protein
MNRRWIGGLGSTKEASPTRELVYIALRIRMARLRAYLYTIWRFGI